MIKLELENINDWKTIEEYFLEVTKIFQSKVKNNCCNSKNPLK